MLRLLGGWIQLELPTPVVVVDGEIRSSVEGARGAAPTDGCSASASARPWRQASTAVLFKAFVRWGSLRRRVRWRWPAPALAGDRAGDFVNVPAAKNPRTWWYFFLLFLRSFLLVGVGQLSSVFLYGLPVCVRVFVRFLNL